MAAWWAFSIFFMSVDIQMKFLQGLQVILNSPSLAWAAFLFLRAMSLATLASCWISLTRLRTASLSRMSSSRTLVMARFIMTSRIWFSSSFLIVSLSSEAKTTYLLSSALPLPKTVTWYIRYSKHSRGANPTLHNKKHGFNNNIPLDCTMAISLVTWS